MKTSDSLTKIAPALLKAQKAITFAAKSADNPFFKSKYADLPTVIDAVKSPLNEAGIFFTQSLSTETTDGKIHLTTRLLHESGEWIEDTATCPLAKQDPQAYGSASTYLRRYSLAAICGLYQDDDDGNAATHAPAPKQAYKASGALISEATKKELIALCGKASIATKLNKALDAKGVLTWDELSEADAIKLLEWAKK